MLGRYTHGPPPGFRVINATLPLRSRSPAAVQNRQPSSRDRFSSVYIIYKIRPARARGFVRKYVCQLVFFFAPIVFSPAEENRRRRCAAMRRLVPDSSSFLSFFFFSIRISPGARLRFLPPRVVFFFNCVPPSQTRDGGQGKHARASQENPQGGRWWTRPAGVRTPETAAAPCAAT